MKTAHFLHSKMDESFDEARRAREERAADDAAGVEDALDLDALGLRIIGVLEEVVVLHLPSQMEQGERPGREHHVEEEAQRVGEIRRQRSTGDEHEEGQHVGMLVVARRPAVEQLEGNMAMADGSA